MSVLGPTSESSSCITTDARADFTPPPAAPGRSGCLYGGSHCFDVLFDIFVGIKSRTKTSEENPQILLEPDMSAVVTGYAIW